MLTVNIHDNQVEISSGIKVLLHGEKPMINLDNTIPTFSKYLTELPNLVGNYFTSDNEVTITYGDNIDNAIVHVVDDLSAVISTDKYITPTPTELHRLYLQMALAYKTTPILIQIEE